jgi:hypothetical protein
MRKNYTGAFALWSGASRFDTPDIGLLHRTKHIKSEVQNGKSDITCDIQAISAPRKRKGKEMVFRNKSLPGHRIALCVQRICVTPAMHRAFATSLCIAT